MRSFHQENDRADHKLHPSATLNLDPEETDRQVDGECRDPSETVLRLGKEICGEEAAFQVPSWLDPGARERHSME